MNKFIFLSIFSFSLLSIDQLWAQKVAETPSSSKAGSEVAFPSASQFSGSKLTYKVIPAANKTFCYDIYSNGRLMIHQPSAPGLAGNEGFKTKADAGKVAEMVIGKIKNGEMPPSVTSEEMKKLGVL